MKIDDLPEEDQVSLYDLDGVLMECTIIDRIPYDGEEYAVCRQSSGGGQFIVVDVRELSGQHVPVNQVTLDNVMERFGEAHPELMTRRFQIKQINETDEEMTVALTDEDGNDFRMEVMDMFEEEERCFVFCMDDEDKEADEVFIFEVREVEGQDDADELISVDDEVLLNHLFEVFRKRNEDYYHFVD